MNTHADQDGGIRVTDAEPGIDFLNQVPFQSIYATLIEHACERLRVALGPRYGKAAVTAVLSNLVGGLPEGAEWSDLRRQLEAGDTSALEDADIDWQDIAADLAGLFIYARHGDTRSLDLDASRAEIEGYLVQFRSMVADLGLKAALGPCIVYLTENLAAAEARWAIDNGRSVVSDQLAALAAVKPKTVANLIASGQIASDGDGRVPAAEALRYLERRKGFVRSRWQDLVPPRPPTLDEEAVPSLGEQVFVPVDGEGNPFLPSLARPGRDGRPRYAIGPKDQPEYVEDYWEALRRLASMATPRWRRPPVSGKGGWSLVSAQDGWRRFARADLDRMVEADLSPEVLPG
ncbi:hypothetical protein [Roseomonas harenae]|uniref:hypothetical protein n=1 Tax=Muricoccus harenae TaxID=2692566 RepID=UPI0013317EA0|nr:hypothetical protein [Roseomonas harenae]